MKKTFLIIFLILAVLFSYSCKKKKDVANVIADTYPLTVMLHLYPEYAGSTPPVVPPPDTDDGDAGTGGTETPVESIVDIRVLGAANVYTETNISPDKPIMVDSGLSVSVKIKARDALDTIYVGGFPIEDTENYSPTSNGVYEFTTVMTGNKSLIIGVSSVNNNEFVEYKTFELLNKGRGYSRMYVHTNLNQLETGGMENHIAEYKVGARSFSTITLPIAQDYTLRLKAIPDGASYNLENWFPMIGIATGDGVAPDENGVIMPYTEGKKNDINAYVNATPIIGVETYDIENPIKLEAVFSAFPAWDGKSMTEPVRHGKTGYIVSLASDLAWLAYQTSIRNTFVGYIFQLQNDIDFNGKEFKGIAVGSQNFFGVFDGNGKAITNVILSFGDFKNKDNYGFIGNLGIRGVVSNLTIAKGVEIITTGGNNIGSIVGRNFGKVENCTNYADIDAGGSSTLGNNIGGIVGYNSSGIISSVYNVGMVSNANSSVGGIVGYNTGTLSSSYNEGLVTGKNEIGGIVGLTEKSITKVYNSAIVSNAGAAIGTPAGNNTGGIAGSIGNSGGQISHSYNIGEVIGGKYAGGVLGYSVGGAVTIDRVYNIGVVNGEANFTGGLIGGISAGTTIGTGANGLLNIYFLKDGTYNSSLDDNGIGAVEASGTPSYASVIRNAIDFANSGVGQHFKPQGNGTDPNDIWFVKSSMPAINGITTRPILLKIGQQE